jgi:hypothetical protein
MAPPPPPGFGQPGYVADPNRLIGGMGGTGQQGGHSLGGGGGSSSASGEASGRGFGAWAQGGPVPGSRSAPVDSVRGKLTAGEFVLRREAADAIGPEVLQLLNDNPHLGAQLRIALSQRVRK